MFIDISGRSVKTSNYVVRKAATFYGEYLLGKKLAENVNLTIVFEKREEMDDDYASCDWVDGNHRSRVFIITIDRTLNKKETILALAHEMVHLKQYAKGELKDIFRPARMTKWQGKNFPMDTTDYWDCPWEWEAYGREKGLYLKFMAHIKEFP